jgi:hypothetical protein
VVFHIRKCNGAAVEPANKWTCPLFHAFSVLPLRGRQASVAKCDKKGTGPFIDDMNCLQ